MRKKSAALVCVVAAALAGCSGGPDQQAVVEAIGTEAIVPNLEVSVEALDRLDNAVADYCADPSTGRDAAQRAWLEAKALWEPAQPNTWFDPGDMLRTVSKVDYTPTSPEGVDRLLESDTVIDADYVDNSAASTQRGLGAIEHLLFRAAEPDERACNLLEGAARVASDSTRELLESWTRPFGGEPAFIDQFTVDMTAREALGDVVGAIIERLKHQTLFEIGKALGISAPSPEPGTMEEGDAGAGARTYRAQLEGIDSWLTVGGEDSLIELIRSRSDEVATEIETRLADAVAGLEAIDTPLEQVATDDPSRLEPIFEDLDRLRTLFEADVVSLLDVTIGFSDSDGDSG